MTPIHRWNVEFEIDVPVKLRDGSTLFSDIYRPSVPGRFPVVLLRVPYDKVKALTIAYRHPVWLARQGYVVIVQNVRGRFRSEGDFTPFVNEAEDGYEAVEWAAELPFSNGAVGMAGFSYAGATQLAAALTKPPSLRVICPSFTSSQYYEGWAYRGGAFALAFNAYWAAQLAMDGARRAGDGARIARFKALYAGNVDWEQLPLADFPPLAGEELGKFFFEWLEHPAYDDYWRRTSLVERYEQIAVPALHIGGWYDTFISGTLQNYCGIRDRSADQRARRQQSLVIGPWWHAPWTRRVGEVDFGPEAERAVDDWQLAWFERHLKGEDTSILNDPVNIFLMGRNEWLTMSDWPPPATSRDLFLDSDGRASSVGGFLSAEPRAASVPDIYVYDPVFPVLSRGGHAMGSPDRAPMGAVDQRAVEALNTVLVYTSTPWERDLSVIGDVTVTLFASTTTPDTDFTAKLCDVCPEGRSYNLLEGIVRARYRESAAEASPVTPGEVYEYRVRLGPVAHTFHSGHRVRIQVSSSDFPQWDRNLNTGGLLGWEDLGQAKVATQLVFHDPDLPSRVTLPVVDL